MLKLLLLVFVAAGAVFFGKWGISDGQAVHLFGTTVYWFVLVNFNCLLYFLYHSYRERIVRTVSDSGWRRMLIFGVVVVGCLQFLTRSEPAGFKTVMDEHIIASTAQGMHKSRVASVSMRYHIINDRAVLLNNKVDKRPVFFPFLVSMVHDVFGYHAENSIRLNVYVLCPLLFVLLYVLGNRLGGAFGGGLLCFLVATIPLCGFTFRGGGLELLNMVMLVAVALIAMDFWEDQNTMLCGALCFATTLLAQSRYESVIFVFPVALIILCCWYRKREITASWTLIITPLLLIPYLWQNRVFSLSKAQWQLEGKELPFSLEYLPANWERSIYYFFNVDGSVPNSWLISGVGLVAGLFVSLMLFRKVREGRVSLDSRCIALALYIPAYIGLFGILLCFSWDFGGPVVQRLCLPLYLPLAVLIIVFLKQLNLQSARVRTVVVACMSIYLIGYALPVSSNRTYNMGAGGWEYAKITEMFNLGELDKEAIYVTQNACFYSIYDYSCVSNDSANRNKQAIVNYMAQPGARPLYMVKRASYLGQNDEYLVEDYISVDPDFQAEVEIERWLSPSRRLTFSRVIGVDGYEPEQGQYGSLLEYQLECLKMLP